jgi:hypothetical protein
MRTHTLKLFGLSTALVMLTVAVLTFVVGSSAQTGSGTVDPTTIDGKFLMGYQGWYACPGDGSALNKWEHWFEYGTIPSADTATVDFWPDTSELDESELCPTNSFLTRPDGSPASLFSSYNQKTVMRHFQWMQQYGIDGVFLGRFVSVVRDKSLDFFSFDNQVAQNVRAGAESYGRVFAMQYDVSGAPAASLVQDIENDWKYLVDVLKITDSPRYLHHNGKPVLEIWGFGFNDDSHTATPQEAQELISFFKNNPDLRYRVTLMGGVPAFWRTLNRDARPDPAWLPVYHSFDIINAFTVRVHDEASADNFMQRQMIPDLIDVQSYVKSHPGVKLEYLPNVQPGYSGRNVGFQQHDPNPGPLNQVPRNGGRLYWRQVYDIISAFQIAGIPANSMMIWGAQFDEVDEGLAMYKMAPTNAELPAQGAFDPSNLNPGRGHFVPLNADGYQLPSDWYLQLAGQAAKMLRGEIPLSATIPIQPTLALPASARNQLAEHP